MRDRKKEKKIERQGVTPTCSEMSWVPSEKKKKKKKGAYQNPPNDKQETFIIQVIQQHKKKRIHSAPTETVTARTQYT